MNAPTPHSANMDGQNGQTGQTGQNGQIGGAARNRTRELRLGPLRLGHGHPVLVQSMTNTDTRDVEATLAQIGQLAEAGCELARLAVPDKAAAAALRAINDASPLPLVADIHFDHSLAIAALEAGLPALRINPGNIGFNAKPGGKRLAAQKTAPPPDRPLGHPLDRLPRLPDHPLDRLVDAAKAHHAVIRVGVNGGSLEKDLLERFGGPTPAAMVESALRHTRMLEGRGFYDIKLSLKSSSVHATVEACRLMAARADYPLHLGVTEAGGLLPGAVKSAVGLGVLLFDGIGDTIRVSLTADPVREVAVAWDILRAAGLRRRGPEIISCPTCGRTEIDLMRLAGEVERHVQRYPLLDVKIAVMGCVVNGPGEAQEAHIGLAGGRDKGVIFRYGQVIKRVRGQDALLSAFLEELDKINEDSACAGAATIFPH